MQNFTVGLQKGKLGLSYLSSSILLPSHGVLLHFPGEGTSRAPPRQLCKQHNSPSQHTPSNLGHIPTIYTTQNYRQPNLNMKSEANDYNLTYHYT